MKILILDERKGNSITDEIDKKIKEADIALVINSDNTVSRAPYSHGGDSSMMATVVTSEFVQVPHRDEISAEESRQAGFKRQAKSDAESSKVASHPVSEKFAAVWEQPDNSGTETIVADKDPYR